MNPVSISSYVCLFVGAILITIWYVIDNNPATIENLLHSEPTPINESRPTDISTVNVTSKTIEDQLNLQELKIADVISTSSLPPSFSFSEYQLVPVRDQGTCGSCWAYTLTKVIASRVKIHSQGKYDLALSPQQLIDCSGAMEDCKLGGNFIEAINFMTTVGVVPESTYPSTSTTWNGQNSGIYQCESKPLEDFRVFADPTSVKKVSKPVDIKKTIFYFGPVIGRIESDTSLFKYEWPTVWEHDTAKDVVNHLVEIIGWDDAKGAWLCRNTWGTGWGESGRFYVAYGQLRDGAVNVNPRVVHSNAAILLDNLPAFLSRYAAADQSIKYDWMGWTGVAFLGLASGLFLSDQLYENKLVKL